jgi:hypothetical protein
MPPTWVDNGWLDGLILKASYYALQPTNPLWPAIFRYVSWAAVFPISGCPLIATL